MLHDFDISLSLVLLASGGGGGWGRVSEIEMGCSLPEKNPAFPPSNDGDKASSLAWFVLCIWKRKPRVDDDAQFSFPHKIDDGCGKHEERERIRMLRQTKMHEMTSYPNCRTETCIKTGGWRY